MSSLLNIRRGRSFDLPASLGAHPLAIPLRPLLTVKSISLARLWPLVVLSAACVDTGTSRQPPATTSPAKVEVSAEDAKKKAMGGWLITRRRSEMDDSPEVSLFVSATPSSHGMLTIRCAKNKTVVDVYAGDTVYARAPTVPVRVRFDDAPAERQRWRGSGDQETLYAPNPIAFARRLARAREFRLEYPSDEGPGWVVLYEVEGLSHGLGEVAKACKWKYTPPTTPDSVSGEAG